MDVVKDGLLPLIFGGPIGLVVNAIVQTAKEDQPRLKEKWEKYIQKTVDYAKILIDKQILDEKN